MTSTHTLGPNYIVIRRVCASSRLSYKTQPRHIHMLLLHNRRHSIRNTRFRAARGMIGIIVCRVSQQLRCRQMRTTDCTTHVFTPRRTLFMFGNGILVSHMFSYIVNNVNRQTRVGIPNQVSNHHDDHDKRGNVLTGLNITNGQSHEKIRRPIGDCNVK